MQMYKRVVTHSANNPSEQLIHFPPKSRKRYPPVPAQRAHKQLSEAQQMRAEIWEAFPRLLAEPDIEVTDSYDT